MAILKMIKNKRFQIKKLCNYNFFPKSRKGAIHNFFPKNRKAAIEEVVKIILWIVFFVVLVTGVYFLIKSLTGG